MSAFSHSLISTPNWSVLAYRSLSSLRKQSVLAPPRALYLK